jgi:RHS repeat-associated protein
MINGSPTNLDTLHIAYDYDAAGRRKKLTYPDGGESAYLYNDSGQLWKVTGPSSSLPTTYGYYTDGRLETETLPNGVEGEFTYDDAGLPKEILYSHGGSTVFDTRYLVRDRNGSPKTIWDSQSGTTTYDYDALNRLHTETPEGSGSTIYNYDAVGNRANVMYNGATTTYSYNDANELQSIEPPAGEHGQPGAPSTTYGYDFNGSRISKTPDGQAATTYTWNASNLLGGITTPTDSIGYLYNGEGERIASVEDGKTTNFVLDSSQSPDAVLQEQSSDDQGVPQSVTYSYGLGLISRKGTDGVVTYPLTDASGSVRVETDSSGDVIDSTNATHSYDAFGNDQSPTADLSGDRFRYAGQYAELDGLSYMRARFYDSQTGAFLSVDPQGSAATSQYAYCADNPMVAIDPSGCNFVSDGWHWVEHHAVDIAITAGTAALDATLFALSPVTCGASDVLAGELTAAATGYIVGKGVTMAGKAISTGIVERAAQEVMDGGLEPLEARFSREQVEAVAKYPYLRKVYLGSKIQFAVRDLLQASYPGRFSLRMTGPDFLDKATGEAVELTTDRLSTIDAHLAKGGDYLDCGYAQYSWPR